MSTRWIFTVAEMISFATEVRSQSKTLALVPTMGALHEGHLSLVRQAKIQCDVVVVSIFVNPAQFGPTEDFARYPRNPEKDFELLESAKVHAVLAPSVDEVFPAGFSTFVDPGRIATVWEGAQRPGHFRGVATVVLRLFNIVRPDIAFFGQKDFQQVVIIRRLVEDLNLAVRIVVCPIVREADGLARSSRNVYLSAEDRRAAALLSRNLKRAEGLAQSGEADVEKLLAEMGKMFAAEPRLQIDYAAIVDPATLELVTHALPGSVALVAGRLGAVRLIDNLIFGPPGSSPEMKLQLALTAPQPEKESAASARPEIDSLRIKIENCRDCAAVNSISLPAREFLFKYLKRDYPNLDAIRMLVIGGCAPIGPSDSPYRNPEPGDHDDPAVDPLQIRLDNEEHVGAVEPADVLLDRFGVVRSIWPRMDVRYNLAQWQRLVAHNANVDHHLLTPLCGGWAHSLLTPHRRCLAWRPGHPALGPDRRHCPGGVTAWPGAATWPGSTGI